MTRQWHLFEKCWPLVAVFLTWKVQRFCWPKGTSLECAESIYVRTTETICLSDELCFCKEEEEDQQIVCLGDSRIERVRDRLDLLNMLTVRVAVLEYNQLHKKAYNLVVCEFGGFEMYCVMRASAPSLYNVYAPIYTL